MDKDKVHLTRKEYLKYNNPYAFDVQHKLVKPGDTVVINDNYRSTPIIGIVDHYTQTGNLAIQYEWDLQYTNPSHIVKVWAYRPANKVIKIKNGNKNKN